MNGTPPAGSSGPWPSVRPQPHPWSGKRSERMPVIAVYDMPEG